MNNITSSNSNRIFNIQNSSATKQGGNLHITNSSTSSNRKSTDNLITSLQKNIEQLEEQKKTLKDQKLDPKDLLEKAKKIDEQISKIKAQIQEVIEAQKEADAAKLEENTQNKKLEEEKYTKNGDEVRDGIIISSTLKILIQANSSKKITQNLNELKSRYERSDPAIAQKIDATIAKELGKTNKAIEKGQSYIIEKNNNSQNTIDTDEKTKKEKETDKNDPESLDNIEKSKDENAQNTKS